MSDENNTPTNLEQIKEVLPIEEPQQQPKEEVKGGEKKPATKIIRLASISRLLDKHTTQLEKVGEMVQPLQTQNNRISKMVQPLQKQLKSIENQTDQIKEIQTQLKQLQKQVTQIQRDNHKIKALLLSKKKKNFSIAKNRYTKRREGGIRRPR